MTDQASTIPNDPACRDTCGAGRWKETTLGEVAVFNYGKGLPTEIRKTGDVPVYGSSGITGFHNEALIGEAGYIIGRKGTVGSPSNTVMVVL